MDESPNPKVSMIASLISDPVGRQSTAAMAAFYNLNFQPDRVERIGWSQAELERLFLAAKSAWPGIEPGSRNQITGISSHRHFQ